MGMHASIVTYRARAQKSGYTSYNSVCIVLCDEMFMRSVKVKNKDSASTLKFPLNFEFSRIRSGAGNFLPEPKFFFMSFFAGGEKPGIAQHYHLRIDLTSFSFSSASRVLNFFCTSLIKRNALLRFAAEATAWPDVLCIELRYVLEYIHTYIHTYTSHWKYKKYLKPWRGRI